MKKTIALITVLFSTITLVACSGSTSNDGAPTVKLSKAVCTSSANWNAVKLGMSLGDVQAILGAPTRTTSTSGSSTSSSTTVYTYESCRGFIESIDATTGDYSGEDTGGSVTWSGTLGVTAITPTPRPTKAIICELDYYNHPYVFSPENCRASSFPF